jgi:hypothetical protein
MRSRELGLGLCACVMAENDAEGMAHRIGENPEARFAFTWDAGGTQQEQFLFGLVGVAHADVQVHLLWVGRIRPPRRNPVRSALESQLAQARPGTDDHPAVDVFIDPHSQHLAVELGQSPWIGAVDHCLLEASDHTGIISALDG